MVKNTQIQLMFSPEDSPANRLALRESEGEQMMTAICGTKCYELFEKQRRVGLSLKMCVGFLLLKTEWYSSRCALIWKPKVTKYNRLLFQLAVKVRGIKGIDYGLLPTLRANLTGKILPNRAKDKFNNLESVLSRMLWPTMRASDGMMNALRNPKTVTEALAREGRVKQHRLEDLIASLQKEHGGYLNPAWGEWFMDYPSGWTLLEEKELEH